MASKKWIFPFKMLDLSTSRYDQMAPGAIIPSPDAGPAGRLQGPVQAAAIGS